MIPLSYGQLRLWFLARLEDSSAAYHVPIAARLSGDLDAAALRAAVTDVVQRHEILRTTYPESDGVPYQRVWRVETAHPKWTEADAAQNRLSTLLVEAASSPFDLTTDLPLRGWLFRMGQRDHAVLLVLHHIASDGWSISTMLRDVERAYRARHAGVPPDWDPLPVQYTDYALWQREVLGTEADPDSLLSRQAAYWRRTLDGIPEELQLPVDRPRPAVASYQGGQIPVRIDAELHRQLAGLGRRHRASLFMVLHAALVALLVRLGAGADIPLGTPVDGRRAEALEGMVGFFVNTLVLRVDAGGDPSFADLLDRVRLTNLAAYTHRDVPFERLVELLNPARSLARHPLFQVMLNFTESQERRLDLPDMEATFIKVGTDSAKFDLRLGLTAHGTRGKPAGITGVIEYAVDLFDSETAAGMVARLHRLLRAAVDDPDRAISRVDLLDDAERLFFAGAATASHPVRPVLPVDLFEEQVAAAPGAPAVRCGSALLSYAELDARANALAGKLIALGAKPERLVVLALPRSCDLLVALVAVWKAGAAYLPVRRQDPAEWIATVFDDAKPVCVVGSPVAGFPPDVPTVGILQQPPTPEEARPRRRDGLLPSHPAYVLYTSGSTGRPKGVVVTHENVANLAAWAKDEFALGARHRALAATPLHFDVSIMDTVVPLLTGGSIDLVEDLLAVADRGWEGELMCAVPSVMNALLAAMPVPLRVGRIVLAGEELTTPAFHQVRTAAPAAVIYNLYGPTETTVYATAATADPASDSRISIGRPIRNYSAYVLSAALSPNPPGVVGELYLSGAGLARGYLNQAALTATRFVASPFGPPGSRLYRTGDLARWRRDGQLEFAGRSDRQIKVRGMRVELGDVEAAVGALPEVSQAVAVARDNDGLGEPRIVVYAIPAGDRRLDPGALRQTLVRRVPARLVPTSIVPLSALPLLPSGKVALDRLPSDRRGSAAGDREFGDRPDRLQSTSWDDREELVRQIVADVLKLPDVRPTDDFFALGGHSLTAIRVVSRVRSMFAVDVSIRAFFDRPSVAGLLRCLDTACGAAVPLAPQPRPERMPLSFAQRRLWFLAEMEGPSATYNIPAAFRLEGALDVAALRGAFADVMARHESLRTLFPAVDGEPSQRICAAALVPSPMRELVAGEEELPDLIALAAADTFDLATDVPVRATLVTVSQRVHVLVLVLHHIAGDGWSMAPLMRDLATAYRARVRREPPAWAALPVQYADYTLWQRDLLGTVDRPSAVLADQLAYWTRNLAGVPEQLDLPTDRPRPATASYRGDLVDVHIGRELHVRLLDLARRFQVTPFMVLQAAFAALLTRLGAGTDIPLGTAHSGRAEPVLDELVGFFVNTLVLRVDTSGDPTFCELLGRVKEADLAAYEHQDVPFEYLVEVLNPARSLARQPLFQVMISFNTVPVDANLDGLVVQRQPVPHTVAKFDLTLAVKETVDADGRPTGIVGALEYATDLFDRNTVQALATRLTRLLSSAVANAEVRVSAIDLLAADERRWLLDEYNATAVAHGGTPTIVELFRNRARQFADRVAITSDDEEISYVELAARADRLAGELAAAGVRPGDVVAVLLDRSPWQVIATVAVVAAGAAYAPVNVTDPPSRASMIMEDAAARVLLTEEAFLSAEVVRAASERGTRVLSVDGARPESTSVGGADPRVLPGSLAYVMFTSGSTGRPKGVAVTHENVVELVRDACWKPENQRRVVMHSAYGFDASTYEIWLPLLTGATVVVVSPGTGVDVRELAKAIETHGVTAAYFTAGLFSVVADECLPTLARLREVWTSGDVVAVHTVRRVLENCPDTTVVHAYGPTETTVWSSYERFAPPHHPIKRLTLGRPMANTRMYVLDGSLGLVPLGGVGELYVAGSHVALGYVSRPGLTASRFVADPFGRRGNRMYRTGDLVRWRLDRTMEFLGRVDGQVKIRGFRIEPAEVEAVAAAVPGVGSVAVVPREDRPGDKRLVAYVVPADPGHEVDLTLVRQQVADHLPDYMVPAAFVSLDELPLTGNGKLDRRALPPPDYGSGGTSRPPRSPIEVVLCGLFADVLGVERTGVDDNFFSLGGHSLLVARLVGRIRPVLGIDLGVRDIFVSPTVAGLLAMTGGQSGRRGVDSLGVVLPLRTGGTQAPLFCIHPGLGLSWCYSGLVRHVHDARPVYGLQARGLLAPDRLPASIDEIAEDYLGEVRAIQPHGPYHLLGWSFGGLVAHAMAVRLRADGEKVALLALLDAYPSADNEGESDYRTIALAEVLGDRRLAAEANGETDPDRLMRLAHAAYPVLSDLGPAEVQVMLDTAAYHARLMRRHRPERFDGDMWLFSAQNEALAPWRDADRWRRYVAGRVIVCDIASTHAKMTDPGPLADIGRLLARPLAAGGMSAEARA